MKVAVLLHWNEGSSSGVFKKVVSQIRAWESFGLEVLLHVVSRTGIVDEWRTALGQTAIRHHPYSRFSRMDAWREAVQAVASGRPDVVYHRYDLWMPQLSPLLRSSPVVLEINTDDLAEYCLRKGLRCWYNRQTRALLLRGAAGFVFVTHELAASTRFARCAQPRVVIGNGIALTDYGLLPPPSNADPHLVFMGTAGQAWHGVDKVVQMAELFPQWHFDVIGPRDLDVCHELPNVALHGVQEYSAYRGLLAQADIAVGTLAAHRNGLSEVCPLKVREYLAHGLPCIMACGDTDFPRGAPFILQLPNTEDAILQSANRIERFVSEWKGRRVPRSAISHLDITVKEQQRVDFFRRVLQRYP